MRVGDQLAGRYRLDRQLGQGGMGEVWRAYDTALDRAVAVKLVREAVASEEAVVRFRREATIGARLQHPGITVVHDVGQEAEQLFIVMELLAGEDLGQALQREPRGLPVAVAVELAAQTAEALAAAHELGVVHRDLKPPNLFLLPGGRLKICDFGIAHSADATAGWTVTGRGGLGTPPYMAPEQWRGEHVDARCDLYALGCVLYALLSGEPPFGRDGGYWALMHRHTTEPPVPLREAGTPVPADLDRLVLRLLAKDPADRPQSAVEVAAALRGLAGPLAGGGGQAGTGTGGGGDQAGGEGGTGAGSRAEDGGWAGGGTEAGAEPWARGGTEAGGGGGGGGGTEAGAGHRAAWDGAEAWAAWDRAEAGDAAGTAGVVRSAFGASGASGVPGEGGADRGGEAVGGGLSGAGQEFLRDLLTEVEDTLLLLPADSVALVKMLGAAADTAARFDADLARRLLRDAEAAAWTAGRSDGVRVAHHLLDLAATTSAHAPARSRRLLAEAHQVSFAVPDPARSGLLRALAAKMTRVDPERARQIADRHFWNGPEDASLRDRIHKAVLASDPEEALAYVDRITDPGRRAAEMHELVLAVGARSVPAALRLAARIDDGVGRLLVLCGLVEDLAAAGDREGSARVLEQAEAALPAALSERAAWLREEADRHTASGRELEGERLRGRAAALLRGRLEAAADEKASHGAATLTRARGRAVAPGPTRLDLDSATERAHRAQNLRDAATRAGELLATARAYAAWGGAPWLPAVSDDPGTPLPPAATDLPAPAGTGYRHVGRGNRSWSANATADELHAAGEVVVRRSGTEVACLSPYTGTAFWAAHADEGVSAAPPLAGSGRLHVSCTADADTVYVQVWHSHEPGARIVAREPKNGRVRWWRDVPELRPLHCVGAVLLLGAPGDLTALDSKTGDVLWQHSVPDRGARSLSAAGDCLLLKDDQLLRALHLPTGHTVWSWSVQPPAHHVVYGAQDLGDGPVHFLDGPFLIALRRSSGRHLWRFDVGPAAEGMLVEEGTVYVAAYDPGRGGDRVVAIDAETGALRWQRALTRHGGPRAALRLLGLRSDALYVDVLSGGRRGRFVRTTDPYVAALDAATGRTLREWEHPADHHGEILMVGGSLVLSGPTLSAYALP
ncbi:serine/threonine-protein kinase [Streptomyces sp. G1]|uniref:protein kinase domain-containing protein n=1 Tax=Streptomyces sp. G1 TaxID=361572 RepID=UPI00202E6BF7|nr:serine/threonine-protein kinase [Streptomyces sp. G1]MCM1968016.1 protein kinase [Streptomyces sp. G1]